MERTETFTIKSIDKQGWCYDGTGWIHKDKLPGARKGDTFAVVMSGQHVISATKVEQTHAATSGRS